MTSGGGAARARRTPKQQQRPADRPALWHRRVVDLACVFGDASSDAVHRLGHLNCFRLAHLSEVRSIPSPRDRNAPGYQFASTRIRPRESCPIKLAEPERLSFDAGRRSGWRRGRRTLRVVVPVYVRRGRCYALADRILKRSITWVGGRRRLDSAAADALGMDWHAGSCDDSDV